MDGLLPDKNSEKKYLNACKGISKGILYSIKYDVDEPTWRIASFP